MADDSKCWIIYDGVCKLCNWWVKFLIKRDRADRFRFVTMNSIPKGKLPDGIDQMIDQSVIVFYQGRFSFRSDGVIQILRLLPGIWKGFSILGVLPKRFRDSVYQLIARKRYRVFGRYEACPLVPKEWRHKFPSKEEVKDFYGNFGS